MKLNTVKRIYDALNQRNFGGVLERPTILFRRMRDVHGFYNGPEMHFNLADLKGFVEVTELVYHEMIHQYIDEFLQVEIADHHGKEFIKQYNKFCSGVTTDPVYRR